MTVLTYISMTQGRTLAKKAGFPWRAWTSDWMSVFGPRKGVVMSSHNLVLRAFLDCE